MECLTSSGLIDEPSVSRLREGFLYFEKPDGNFRKYYCMLFKTQLVYFHPHERVKLFFIIKFN